MGWSGMGYSKNADFLTGGHISVDEILSTVLRPETNGKARTETL